MSVMSFQQAAATFALWRKREQKAHKVVLLRMAQDFRRAVIVGITQQAPGGKPFAPLSPRTLAARKAAGFGGTKILIVTAQLRNSITVAQPDPEHAFVGVLKTARRKDGKEGANIAAVHEFGARTKNAIIPKRSFLVATYTTWLPGAKERLSKMFGQYLLTGKADRQL